MHPSRAALATKQPVLPSASRAAGAEVVVGPYRTGNAGEVSAWIEVTDKGAAGTLDARILGSLEEDAASARRLENVAFTQFTAVGFAAKVAVAPIPPFVWIAYTVGTNAVEFQADLLVKEAS